MSAEVNFQRLQKMIKERSPGRHTPVAQFNLGYMYDNGEGVTKNHTEAGKWFRLAADQGDAQAQFNLGYMYRTGKGVAYNHVEAEHWFKLAADQGGAPAQYNLGYMYDNGEGVAQSHEEAAKWYQLAANQGDVQAQHNLGCMYATGQGVDLNLDQAEHWFKLAADQGYANAQQALIQVAADRAASTTITTATQPKHAVTWPAGTQVVVHGLGKAAELNGRAGTIVRWVADKGQYQVDLDGRPNSIKPTNLKLG